MRELPLPIFDFIGCRPGGRRLGRMPEERSAFSFGTFQLKL